MSYDLRHLLAVLALAAAAVAPAAGFAQEDAGAREIEEIDIDDLPPPAEETCFYSRDIDRFSALSDSFVLLRDRSRKYYLLTMFPGCVGLDRSIRIALISDLQRVCANAAPIIGYEGQGGADTCPIMKIESVEDREAAERLVELRSER